MVACRNPARKEEILYSFTTLDLKANRILALYKPRWHIETDLRSLKRTVNLHEVASKAKTGWEKEVLMAVSAYYVVRAVMYLSAAGANLRSRQLSTSAAQEGAEFHHPRENLGRGARFPGSRVRILVWRRIYYELLTADSKGCFFNRHIRGHSPYARVSSEN